MNKSSHSKKSGSATTNHEAERITTINPYTEQPINVFAEDSPREIEKKLQSATNAYVQYHKTSAHQRTQLLVVLAETLTTQLEKYAQLITEEMGKPISQSRAEIEKCRSCLQYYVGLSEKLAPHTIQTTPTEKTYFIRRPLGLLLTVMPWNFPFWQLIRVLVPNLLLGNIIVLKHATNTTGCALLLQKWVEEACHSVGLKYSVMHTLVVRGARVSALIADRRISAVTLTGSLSAGRSVAEAAAKAVKKSVLELGGSDPYVVLADADIDLAAKACASSRLINSGQSCVAAKRFIVDKNVYEVFIDSFAKELSRAQLGDPMQTQTTVGPLARLDLVLDLKSQLERSLKSGSRAVELPIRQPQHGFFFTPTLLVDVQPEHPAFSEETFGPLAAVTQADSESDAMRLANQTSFGLGAAVFTQDLERGEYLAQHELHAGMVAINQIVRSDPRLPFGGVGESGYGRELGEFGLNEFANVKTILGV